MPAIATTDLRNLFADLLRSDITSSVDSSPYYVGFGKADLFDSGDEAPIPDRSKYDEMLARSNLQSIKKIVNNALVVPRKNWTSGTLYVGWDDDISVYPENPFYVLTEENQVYVCLSQGKDGNGNPVASIVTPSYSIAGVNPDQAFKTSDGYTWKFLYKIDAVSAANYLSSGFMPVAKVQWDSAGDSDNLNPDQLTQLIVQNEAIPGQILGFEILNPGVGYTTAPTITINGDGNGAEAVATVSNGRIIKVDMLNESAGLGSGYNVASAVVSGDGIFGDLRPIIGPSKGFGYDAAKDLKSTSAILNVITDGVENDDFIIGNDFRQITVFKEMKDFNGDNFSSLTGIALNYITMDGVGSAATFTVDNILIGDQSGAQAYIDKIDGADIYYHQNETTGFTPFISGEDLNETNGNGSGTIVNISEGEVDRFSGDLLYLENRSRIIRSSVQQEDIKVVITL